MLGILFAIGAALSSGVEKILRRHVLVKEDSLCYTFVFSLLAGIILLPAFFLRFEMPSNNMAWFLLVTSGTLWALYSILLFKAYAHLEASVASPLSRLKLFFVLILSIIVLGETLTLSKVVGTALIFGGVVALGYKRKVSFNHLETKGIKLLIAGTVVISIALLIDKYAMKFFNVETYTAPIYLICPLLLLPFMLKRKSHIKSIMKNSFIATFLTALLSVGYYYLTLYAFKYAEASVIVPITELSTLFAVLGGIIFLHERTHIKRKLAAAVLVIAGALAVAGIF